MSGNDGIASLSLASSRRWWCAGNPSPPVVNCDDTELIMNGAGYRNIGRWSCRVRSGKYKESTIKWELKWLLLQEIRKEKRLGRVGGCSERVREFNGRLDGELVSLPHISHGLSILQLFLDYLSRAIVIIRGSRQIKRIRGNNNYGRAICGSSNGSSVVE